MRNTLPASLFRPAPNEVRYRWKAIRQNSVGYGEAFKAGGGSFDLVDLPDAGIKGNSHMVMMDKNSDQVADLIQKWLVSKGLKSS